MPETRDRILIVRIVALGDVANVSALLTRIRTERPGAHVTWMVGRRGAELVRLFDGVDRIIEVDEGALFRGSVLARAWTLAGIWTRLLFERFSLVIIAHADARYRWLTPLVPASRLRMFGERSGRGPIVGQFIGDEAARLLDELPSTAVSRSWALADVRSRVREAPVPPDAEESFDVVIVPGGARNVVRDSPLRRWPTQHYVDLAKTLVAEGSRVALIGDQSDRWVSASFDGLGVVDLIGQLSILQTLKVLSQAGLVVTHDTGPLHFARLVRAPIVAIFGPTAPKQMVGNPPDVTIFWGGEHLACRPCYDGREFAPCLRNVCMEEVTVGSVLAAVRSRLADQSVPSAAPTV
jgi:heptosyltransferase-2